MFLNNNHDIRIYRYFIYQLHLSRVPCTPPIKETPREYALVINNALQNIQGSYDSNGNIIDSTILAENMLMKARQSVIPDSSFDWLEIEKRGCMWLWLNLRTIVFRGGSRINIFDHLQLPGSAATHLERLVDIGDYFDRLAESAEVKITKMNVWREKWAAVYNCANYLKDLDIVDEEHIDYVWQYIKKKIRPRTIQLNDFSKRKIPIEYLSPLSVQEKFLSIYGVFDVWHSNPEAKELFLMKMNKNLSQKKYRKKTAVKVLVSTSLYTDTRDKLHELMKSSGKRKSEVLEYLINQEYEKNKKE